MHKQIGTAAALLCSVSGFAAHAQTAASVSADAQAQQAGAASDTDIIVTAQKVEQRANDVPITISAVSAARMEALGVSDLDEVAAYIPGLNIQEQSANNPGIVIRGITSDSGSAQESPRVTLYYNGVDISRSRGAYQAVYDLERIEVVKGPQATLFGTAAAVGAISMISARPKAGYESALTGGIGNYDSRLLRGMVNLGNEVIAGRIAFEYKKHDGYVHNLSATQDDLYAQNQFGLRGSLRFTPNDKLTVDLIGTFDRQRNSGTPFVSKLYPTASGPGNPFGDANLSGSPVSKATLGYDHLGLRRNVYDGNLTLSYDFADHWNFTTVNGYRDFDSREVFDADGSAAWYLEFAENAKGWQVNHESRFTYTGDGLRVSAGWNFFHENNRQVVPFSTEEGTFAQCAQNVVPGLGCIAPNGTVTASQATALLTKGLATVLPYSSTFANLGVNDSWSVFGDVAWKPTDRLELTAGVRVLAERRKSGYYAIVPNSVLTKGPLIPGQVDTGGTTLWAHDSFQAVLPRFNVLFRLNADVNLYATVSKGRRSPVVKLDAQKVNGVLAQRLSLVPEETVWNYEGGVKGKLGMLSGSLGVYYQKYNNFQVSVIDSTGKSVTQSAGSAGNLGVEAELNLKPASWLNVFGNIGYIDGGIDNSAANGQFRGNKFRLQPGTQAAAGFTIDAPLGDGIRFFATPSVTYRSKIYFELPNKEAISQKATTLFNARAGVSFADGRYEVAGWMRNITNEKYLLDAGNTGGAFGDPTYIPGEPRFYGVELSGRF